MISSLQGVGIEHYGGHTREYPDNTPIVIVRGSGEMSRKATDDFADLLVDTVERNDALKQYVYMDVSSKSQGFAPYSMTKMNQVLNNLPKEKEFYVSSVISIKFIAQLVNIFLRGRRGKFKNLIARIFSDHDEAMAWLKDQVTTPPQEKSDAK